MRTKKILQCAAAVLVFLVVGVAGGADTGQIPLLSAGLASSGLLTVAGVLCYIGNKKPSAVVGHRGRNDQHKG